MGKKLYVGNLPYSATSETLHDMFAQIGPVDSATVITDRESGRSKGFGFVEMSTDALATESIQRFDGANYDGRAIAVSEARPMAPRTDFRGGNRSGGGRGGYGDRRY